MCMIDSTHCMNKVFLCSGSIDVDHINDEPRKVIDGKL
jgi:hypothetical protein